ncbi:MAG: hypothetical protein QXV68_04990, partial [Candidatus Caldarchaeum sp.]
MEKHRFVCSNCGAEYWLQAWKAVCPNCMQEFTLELREVKQYKGVVKSNKVSALALAAYAVYALALPATKSLLNYFDIVPTSLTAFLMLLMALLAYLGSEPAAWAGVLTGLAAGLIHIQTFSPPGLVGAVLAFVWTSTALIYLNHMRRLRKHIDREPNARTMPEYSGWGGRSG